MQIQKIDYKWAGGIVFSILLSVVTVVLTKPQKKLSIIEASSFKLTSLNSVKDLKITLDYQGKEISDLWQFNGKIENVGNVGISESDFQSEIILEIDSNATIIQARTIDKSPNYLPVKTEFSGNRFMISPTLLNPNEYIKFEILFYTKKFTRIKSRTRIAGIDHINFKKENELELRYHIYDWPAGFIATVIGLFFIYHCILFGLNKRPEKLKLGFLPLALLGILLWGVGISLMDNGARHYGIYPSLWLRILIFAPTYFCLIILVDYLVLRHNKAHHNTNSS